MLWRFSLYGFLKNQLYFEPFFAIILLGRGLDFFGIGVVFAVADVVTNVLEVPSGWVADHWGRRRSMVLSFTAYLASFVVYAFADGLWWCVPAAACYGVGEAFRSGTHKAMIFEWLRRRDRLSERTRVYGFTRSWSQVGSAVAMVISAGLALTLPELRWLFLVACVPYGLGIVNLWTYPSEVEHQTTEESASREGFWGTLALVFRRSGMRRLVFESCAVQGVQKLLSPYVPVVLALAGLPAAGALADAAGVRGAGLPVGAVLWIAGVVAALHLFAALGSVMAHRISQLEVSPEAPPRRLWALVAVAVALQAAGVWTGWVAPAAVGFVALAFLYNAWRPAFLTRFDRDTPADRQATVLSVESQAATAFTAVLAPLAGAAADRWGLGAVFGLCLGLAVLPLTFPSAPPTSLPRSRENS
jgi:MFS family permease